MTKVLHILDHSLPEQSGYAFRGHAIIRQLVAGGIDLNVITGPKQGASKTPYDEIDGIRYLRSDVSAETVVSGVRGQLNTIAITRQSIREALKAGPVDILHAHSPCLNGLAALAMGTPLLYEMRSSWEDAAVSVGTTTEGSLRYRVSRWLETFVAQRAAAVVVICEGLRRELIARGIAADKITVVPNALPEDMFERPPAAEAAAVRERYDLRDKKIIGFFGSFFEWEGVDSLIDAMPDIVSAVPEAHLLLAGGGRQEKALHALVERKGLSSRVTFAGRIAHDQVPAFYGAADVMAFARVSDRLTNMVTPLKPLEAMAQKTLVVASDVGGHRELIENDKTGRLFRAGDRGSLVETLISALISPEENARIIEAGHAFVCSERRWANVAKHYLPVYERLSSAGQGKLDE